MSNPRIIGGVARGKRLQGVPGEITRPVTDRVKEAVFNILGTDIQNSSFLDLFGGTGSVGIEALSRGAAFVCFIDIHRAAILTIRENLNITGLSKNSDVIQMDAFRFLNQNPHRQFDYIYVAPPQYQGLWKKALNILDKNPGWLSDDGWIIVQIDPKEYEELSLNSIECFDQRKYGSTLLLFFQKSEISSESNDQSF